MFSLPVIIISLIIIFTFINVLLINFIDKRDKKKANTQSNTTSDGLYNIRLLRVLNDVSSVTTTHINDTCIDIRELISDCEELVKFDFYIISMWFLRFACTIGSSDEIKVRNLTDKITSEYKRVIVDELEINDPLYAMMFSNRMSFYDQLYMKSKNTDDFLKSLSAEFAIIIQHDMINEGYEPFYSTSPLPLYGFDIVMHIEMCVNSYLSTFSQAILGDTVEKIRKYARIDE